MVIDYKYFCHSILSGENDAAAFVALHAAGFRQCCPYRLCASPFLPPFRPGYPAKLLEMPWRNGLQLYLTAFSLSSSGALRIGPEPLWKRTSASRSKDRPRSRKFPGLTA
jgi:hypothetical protein